MPSERRPSKQTDRVVRGGSWNNTARNCRSAARNRNHPGNSNDNLGFRLAQAPNQGSSPGFDQGRFSGVGQVFDPSLKPKDRQSVGRGQGLATACWRSPLCGVLR